MKSEDILKKAQDLLSQKSLEKQTEKAQTERDRAYLVETVGKDLANTLRPVLEDLAQAQQITIDSLRQMLKDIKVEVPQTEVRMPTINVPRPQVNVSVPEFKMPPLNIPAPQVNFPERMSVSMDSVNNKAPLPVMMMDSFGKPMSFSMGAGGGGKADFLTIKDIRTSLGASWFNDEGLRVSGSFSVTASNSSTQAIDSSGEAYSVANPMPVQVVSGGTATTGVNLLDSSGVGYSGSNPVPVTITSGATATTAVQNLDGDGNYRGTFPVQGTVAVSGISGSLGATILNGEGVARDTWGSSQVGTWNISTLTGITNSTGVSLLGSDGLAFGTTKPIPVTMVTGVSASVVANLHDSSGVGYSGSNPLPVTFVSGVSASTATSLIDSTGIGYSGSNPVPVTLVSGGLVSTIAVGSVVADAVDDGSAPVQQGGIARTANPTAVAGGDVVKASYDDLGRGLMRAQARDLLSTAYVSLTTGTETTLLSATAGFYYDLVYIMGANNSDAVATVDIRGVSGGNILMTLVVPPYGTSGVSLPVPLPQTGSDGTGNNWTADMNDITGTTVYVSALFSKEI